MVGYVYLTVAPGPSAILESLLLTDLDTDVTRVLMDGRLAGMQSP